jgi:hypothetical protein
MSKAAKFSAGTDEGLKTRRVVKTVNPQRSNVKPTQPGNSSAYEVKEPIRPKHTQKQAQPKDNSPKKTKAISYDKNAVGKKAAPKAIVQGNWNTGGAKTVKKGSYQYRKVGK